MRVSKTKQKQIEIYRELLLNQNQSFNLFSRKESKLKLKLLFEQGALTGKALSLVFKSLSSPVLDIGSGNGFPGLLLAILFPKNVFYLCERSRKKAEFLKHTASRAKINNAKALCQSAEDLKETFEVVLSQAAGPLDQMLRLLEKVLSSKGQAFLWQSYSWKKNWPKTSLFIPTVFKSYKTLAGERLLLKIQKSPGPFKKG